MATSVILRPTLRGVQYIPRRYTSTVFGTYINKVRPYSSSSRYSEQSLDTWIEDVQKVERVYEDEISISKVQDLYCTLPTRSDPAPPGTTSITTSSLKNLIARPPRLPNPIPAPNAPLEPVHALIFFHPRTPEALLGPDQTDTQFGPPAHLPFGRRMWAGGQFFWQNGGGSKEGALLGMGRKAEASARVVSVEKKGFEKGAPMVFVRQRIAYRHAGEKRTLYEEERTHVYLPSDLRADNRVLRKVDGLPSPDYTYSWTPTPTTLFRFSALTWNAHLIHLDREYANIVEGYPERLVHGPLTALMLVEALRSAGYGGRIDNYEYRAHNPVVVGQRQHLNVAFSKAQKVGLGKVQEKRTATLWAEDDAGFVGMTAIVDLLDS